MTLVATFDAPNSRVQLDGTSIPEIPGMDVLVERESGSGWVGVRNGYPASVSGNAFQIFDYEFTPNVLNQYRVRTDFVYDTFSRTSNNSWGSADSGQAYTFSTGTAADWDVAGGVGTYVMSSATGTVSRQTLTTVSAVDLDYYVQVSQSQTVTGGGLLTQFRARGGGNEIVTRVRFNASGSVDFFLFENGVTVGTANAVFSFTAADSFNVRTRLVGKQYQAKIWRVGTVEPATWTLQYTSILNPVGGSVSVEAGRESGNTNTNPVASFDNLHVADLATTNTQYSDLGTDDVTPMQDTVWLKFPLRPFLNREITLCNWGDEVTPSRAQIFDVLGRRRPVAVSELRGSRRFPILIQAVDSSEAEAIELALSFGDVVYLQTPGPESECGLNRRRYPAPGYFDVGDLTKARPVDGVPLNILDAPLIEVDAPDPSIEGSGVTWQGIINAFDTWQDVLTAFASWADVLAYQSAVEDEVIG